MIQWLYLGLGALDFYRSTQAGIPTTSALTSALVWPLHWQQTLGTQPVVPPASTSPAAMVAATPPATPAVVVNVPSVAGAQAAAAAVNPVSGLGRLGFALGRIALPRVRRPTPRRCPPGYVYRGASVLGPPGCYPSLRG